MKNEQQDIFEVIRKQHNLMDYCEQHGIDFHKVGKTYRANSPFGGGAHNSFRIDDDNSEFWCDYQTNQQGDIVNLCALLNHDGNIGEAIRELAPEGYAPHIDKFIKDRRSVQDLISGATRLLMDESQPFHGVFMQYLEGRGVTKEQIERCKLGYLNGRLLIPRLSLDGKEALYYTTRRMPGKNGQELGDESEARYMKAYAEGRPFLAKNTRVPLGLQTLSRDSKILVLCEGDFDTLNFEDKGYAVLGSGGSDNFRSKEAWQIICNDAEKREFVLLAFDNDSQGREYAQDMGKRLFNAGIPFKRAILPSTCKDINDYYKSNDGNLEALVENAMPGLEFLAKSFIPEAGLNFTFMTRSKKDALKKSLKDFLITAIKSGADKPDIVDLCEILKSDFPEDWLKEVIKKAEQGESEYEIVEAIRELYNIMYNEKTGFYEYDDRAGVWNKRDDTTIGAHIREYLSRMATARKINSTLDQLKKATDSEAPIEKLDRLPLFAFKNGTLHFDFSESKGDFKEGFDANDFVTSRRIYNFDRNAKCPEWEQALQVIYQGDMKSIYCLQEYAGACLLNDCRFQKALFLRGEGGNGKSLICEIFRALFGNPDNEKDNNVTDIEMSGFADAFRLIFLKGAKVNISTENQGLVKEAFTNLKKVIAGEKIQACYKGRDFISFRNYAKLIFALNECNFTGENYALLRRVLLIEHNVKFVDDPTPGTNEVKIDRDIKKKLMQELPGIWIWAFKGLQRLLKQGHFTITDATASLIKEVKPDASTISSFIDDVIPSLAGQKISRDDLYSKYYNYCYQEGFTGFTNQKFHKPFTEAIEKKKLGRTFQPHGETRYYEFFSVKHEPEQIAESSQLDTPEPLYTDQQETSQPEQVTQFPPELELSRLVKLNYSAMSTSEINTLLKKILAVPRKKGGYPFYMDLYQELLKDRSREQDLIRIIKTRDKLEGNYDSKWNYEKQVEEMYKYA